MSNLFIGALYQGVLAFGYIGVEARCASKEVMPQTKEMSFSTKVIKMTRSTTYRDNQWWTEGEKSALQSASRPPGQADFASLNSSQAI
jgi:hypothetical protein